MISRRALFHAVAGSGCAEGGDHVVAGVSQGGGHRHHPRLGLVAVLGEAVLADRGQLGLERGVVGDGVGRLAGQLPVPQKPIPPGGGACRLASSTLPVAVQWASIRRPSWVKSRRLWGCRAVRCRGSTSS